MKLLETHSNPLRDTPHAFTFRRDRRQKTCRNIFQIRRAVEHKEHAQTLLEQSDSVLSIRIPLREKLC